MSLGVHAARFGREFGSLIGREARKTVQVPGLGTRGTALETRHSGRDLPQLQPAVTVELKHTRRQHCLHTCVECEEIKGPYTQYAASFTNLRNTVCQ